MRCKPLYSIICLLLVAFLFSCSKNAVEFDEQLSNTRALLSIDLTQNAGEEQVAIKTVRFVYSAMRRVAFRIWMSMSFTKKPLHSRLRILKPLSK